MNENLFVGLILTVVGALIVAGIGGTIAMFFNVNGKISDLRVDMSERIGKLEVWKDLMAQAVATSLHSPHTPELDALIEKFNENRHLEPEQWMRVKEICEIVEADKSLPQQERALAGMLLAQARTELHLPSQPGQQHLPK